VTAFTDMRSQVSYVLRNAAKEEAFKMTAAQVQHHDTYDLYLNM
jgi:hypothetical protein